MATFEAEVHRLWEPSRLRDEILKSQRARRFAWQALMRGRQNRWEFQPPRRVVADGGSALDLNDLERRRRFPPPQA